MAPPSRIRSASPDAGAGGSSNKKARVESEAASAIQVPSDPSPLAEKYESNGPYKHISVAGLFNDELLENVVSETRTYGVRHEEGSLPGWGWEEKETDIYKIRQTPDLTSLDPEHLPEETLQKLPYLSKLKEGIYSPEFRKFVRKVTGCGPLSGKKVDGSVGLYSQGSHLLLHDDSISTRVVSYILYLPNSPLDAPSTNDSSLQPSLNGTFLKGWKPEWGGALELYPVQDGKSAVGPPATKRSAKVDVQWGNLIFFEVQPGKSYHSVEEVVVGDNRQRLGISGWFHRPIEGEEGYEAEDKEKKKLDFSSLAQITAAPPQPFIPYELDPATTPDGLTSRHLKFLSKYLSASYLTIPTLEKLAGQFVEASEVVMHNFLKPELAEKIKQETSSLDKEQYAPYNLATTGSMKHLISPHDLGESESWELQGPSSKHRYLGLKSEKTLANSSKTPTLHAVLTELYPSDAFRAWLSSVSSLVVLAYRVEARRFRRGLDYTLAAGEERDGEPRLDGVLGVTWWAKDEQEEEGKEGEEEQDVGGWECYLASPDEDSDPAVYQSGRIKRADEGENDVEGTDANADVEEAKEEEPVNGASSAQADGPKIMMGGVELEFDQSQLSDGDFDTDSEGGEDDDGPLLSNTLGFNKFLLVLRDPGVMRFVKYLSNSAEGSRWDISGEWEVGQLEEEEEEQGEGATEEA